MNSILNYFSKTPKTDKDSVKTPKSSRDDVKTPKSSRDDVKTPKSSREGVKTPKSSREGVKTPKSNRHNVKTGSDRENTPRGAGKRRIEGGSNPKAPKRPRRVVLHDSDLDDEEDAPEDVDDSGDEYKPEGVVESSSDEEDEEMLEDEATTSDEESPQEKTKKTSRKAPPVTAKRNLGAATTAKKPLASPSTASTRVRLSAFSSDDAPVVSGGAGPVGGGTVWEHDKLDFLKPANRKDASGRGPDHPDFDPRTLQVPDAFLKNVSPAQAQWWKIKSRMFDTVLFFKVGKFYELYHMDAVIGVEELNLLYMKGEMAHSGFPEISYGRFSSTLLQKGFKVARIEQTETPEMMAERCQRMTRPTKFDRVVNREVCRITTPGTRTCGVIEGEVDTEHKFLLALVEQVESGPGSVRELGVSFVDTTVGLIRLGQFSDDRHLSRLRTLLAHYEAAQVVYPRGSLSPQLASVLSSSLGGCLREPLNPRKECPTAEETLKWLAEKKFFTQDENHAEEADKENAPPLPWPPELLEHTSKDVGPSPRPRPGCELALSALGMLGKYLDKCGIGHSILSLKQVSTYRPSDLLVERAPRKGATKTPPHMESGVNLILDDIALRNLEILVNESTGSVEGTLLQQMDRCKTQFGKRLLRRWLSAPLTNPVAINARLDALAQLMEKASDLVEIAKMLRTLPDLERALAKMHSLGLKGSSDDPNSRAIFYEDTIYSKKKVLDFIALLDGFKTADEIASLGKEVLSVSPGGLLHVILSPVEQGGKFPALGKLLHFFSGAFDREQAKREGRIVPAPGVDAEYDGAQADEAAVDQDATDYLREQARVFGCKVVFVGTAKNRYQLEVPETAARRASDNYHFTSQRKGFRRFVTTETKALLSRKEAAEERRAEALRDIARRIFKHFDQHFSAWKASVECLGMLDVLLSMAEFSGACEGCRPQILLPSTEQKPFLEIVNGRHPCLWSSSSHFIPNSTSLGGEARGLLLLTGANMGGKSTLMRQTGLLVILAQLGCYVPAESMRLTPADRVFCRLGASDALMKGESTFYVELSETSAILKHATPYSLVLIDELGRGTATFDGTAIASAVASELAEKGPLTIFSSHYHTLTEEFQNHPRMQLGHMACMVEDENEDPTQETITFLYQLEPGACPKSYGFNVARLAGLPDDLIRLGNSKAKEFERKSKAASCARLLLRADVMEEIGSLVGGVVC